MSSVETLSPQTVSSARYRAINWHNLDRSAAWGQLSKELREAIEVVSQVLPFRTNEYVIRELIDWRRVPHDPMFQLTFGQRDMLDPESYERILRLLRGGASRGELRDAANAIRQRMNPHPAGQMTHNQAVLDGQILAGLQHKYRETVLFFPSQGQTCHAYCTYCFRWPQFVDLPDMRFKSAEVDGLVAYLGAHPEVSDVLITGGDPLIMKTTVLRRYLEPLLSDRVPHLRHIRIGTKALAYWPHRFLTDPDADDLLRLFAQVVASGRRLVLMVHFSHPVELTPVAAREAIRRLLDTGAEMRLQAPIVRHVNDRPEIWAELWRQAVALGIAPYYMFIERDTGPRRYFEVPLGEAHEVFRLAYNQVSGLARTVRGPVMSTFPGKVRILGTARIHDQPCFVLDFVQARDPDWVRRPFFATYDPEAVWLDQLRPAFGERAFFFESTPGEEQARP